MIHFVTYMIHYGFNYNIIANLKVFDANDENDKRESP